MISTTRSVMLSTFGFFAFGEIAAKHSRPLAELWAFLSPLEWVASLVLVMTGQLHVVEALMQGVLYAGHGATSTLVAAVLAGAVGTMFGITLELIVRHTRSSSRLGGILFMSTFAPIWTVLVLYKALSHNSGAFRALTRGLESLAYEIRLSTGFGILLLAVITPMLVLLFTKVLEIILQPEKSYSDGPTE